MIVLVFSDTHGDELAYRKMLEHEKDYDTIYCLGDSGFSESFLKIEQIVSVKGNYPFAPKNPYDITARWHGFSFFFTHGHRYHVKFGLSRINQKADLLRMDVCFFGHTHQHYLEKKNELILANPGALSFGRSNLYPSYMKLIINDETFQIQLINLINHHIIKTISEEKHG